MSAAPGPVQRAAYRVWLAVGAVVLIWIAGRVLAHPLAVIFPPLLLATVIVYLLAPIVAALERRGVPRWAGTLLAYLSGVLVVVLLGTILVPLLTDQLQAFTERLPDLLASLGQDLDRRLAPLGIDVPIGDSIDSSALQGNIEQAVQGGALPSVAGVLGGLSGLALGLLQILIVLALGPVIAFYSLVALPRLRDWAVRLIPPRHRAEAMEVGTKLHLVVGGFIRGQLLVALFVGIVTSIGLALLGLPFWLLVGVTAGATNVVPLLGPFVAGALGVSIALVSEGVGLAALVVVVMIAVQQIDNHVISPLVMGRNVRVHPLVVLLALVIAGTVYGVIGLLIAIPSVAAGSVLVRHFWETRVPWAHTSIVPQDQTAPDRITEHQLADLPVGRGEPGERPVARGEPVDGQGARGEPVDGQGARGEPVDGRGAPGEPVERRTASDGSAVDKQEPATPDGVPIGESPQNADAPSAAERVPAKPHSK